ncbi:unnamed protein product [Penicillium salamii]|nr:unnamed protein product [Penicillium salamii]CAG8414322.1 unnamed protein product [Penicillium salamii]
MPHLPMHYWDSSNDYAVAPSPIVRTYRPDPPKRKSPNMPSPRTAPPVVLSPRPDSGPRPQARSAGTAERPGRNESLVDLVRFFQTQNMTPQILPPPTPSEPQHTPKLQPEPQHQPPSPPDTTTALPIAISPKESKPEIKQDLKPFHRRLLQFAQRPKKEPSAKSKKDEQQRQIEALTREGYLIPPPLQKGAKTSKDANQSKESLSLSISRSLSKSKRDVENIGQPWLQAKGDDRKRPIENSRQLGSLDLGDFGSMVDVSVSLSEFDDAVPPPYQPNDNGPSSSSSMIPVPGSVGGSSPANSIRPPSSIASTSRSYRNVSIDEQLPRPTLAAPGADATSQENRTAPKSRHGPASVKDTTSTPRTSCDSLRRDQSDRASVRNVTPSQPALKLFPDVAPPRKSSNTWRASVVPRNQIVNNLTVSSSTPTPAPQAKSATTTADSEAPRKSSDVFTDGPTNVSEPQCAGALEPSAASSQAPSEKAAEEPDSTSQAKSRRTSLSMGTLKAFPLPAPTRPLPSLPEVGRSPSAPPDSCARSIRSTRSGPGPSNLQSSSSAVPDTEETESTNGSPSTLGSRPATAVGSIGAGGSLADDEDSMFTPSISENSKSTPGLYTARGRASSVRIPRMQELPETPSQDKGQPLADSPVLGHGMPTKPNGKSAAKGLQINSKVARTNLPFGLPSPPPTGSLPSAPPQHAPPAPPESKTGQRNVTAPHGGKYSSMKSKDVPAGPGSYRNSMISRSDSSRSSLRNESFPDSYEERESHQQSRPESPIASSDDEVTGSKETTKHSRREPTKHKRIQIVRREHETADTEQPSRSRLRYPQPTRPVPHSRSSHSLDQTSSQQYSQQSYRPRESHNNRSRAHSDHYLEDRVANLERQNQMLQAALMAALNASGKNPLEGLNIDPNMIPSFQNAPYVNQHSNRHTRRDSWLSSSQSSNNSTYDANCKDSRANVKQFDHMIEDIESGWMSDKSSLSGARAVHRH